MKKKIPPPYSFIFDYLGPKEPTIKPMFGCFAIYIEQRLVFILRKRKDHPKDNGVWIATSKEHHSTLAKEFASMRSISFLGKEPTNWQLLPESADDFEASVLHACRLVAKGDPRIGRITRLKSRKTKPQDN